MAELDQHTVFERYGGGWAFVAGASAGLGAAFAMEAARHGFDVALLARREARLRETAERIESTYGRSTRCIVADLASEDVGEVVSVATADLDVSMLVYDAAAEPEGPFLDMTVDDDRLNLAINCATPTTMTRHFATRMRARGSGAIALVSSMAALQGIKWFTTYGAAKAYQLILAEGLWHELSTEGVDVVGYVVGATASENFIGASKDAAADAPVDDTAPLRSRIHQPARPEDVASRLYERLHLGPRQYSHDTDEVAAEHAAHQSRAEVVRAMGEVTYGLARFEHLRAGYRPSGAA